jgi:serine/threonine-protein kinase
VGLSTALGPGSELLGYRIERVLGRGGMGVVYLAHQVVLDRMVALKLLAPELAEDAGFRDRFLRESRIAASLEHPSIVPIYDAGEVEGRLYIAMRYVEGSDLGRVLEAEAPLAPELALALLRPIADALDAAHDRGLVHRDVKPANILVDDANRPYLADFGLTKEAFEPGRIEQSHFAASIDYVAPEQIERAAVGAAADLYSFGCVLFECLTGRPPFRSDSVMAALWEHANEPSPAASGRNPALPAAIDAVLGVALAKDPSARQGTCRELVDAAQEALVSEQRTRIRALVRNTRMLVAATVVALAVIAGLAVVMSRDGRAKPPLRVTNNTLVRIDPATNRIAAVTRVGSTAGAAALLGGAEGVAVGGDTVWVYNWDSHAVWAIDADTGAVERTIGIAGSTPFGPANSVAADEDGAWVLSSDAGQGLVTRVRAGLEFARTFAFDYDPLVLGVGYGSVWVGGKRLGSSQVVLRMSRTTGAVRAVVSLRAAVLGPENNLRVIQAIAVGEGAVWVLLGRTLFRIDPATSRVTRTLAFDASEPVALAAGGGAVWVSIVHPDGSMLERVDPETVRVTRTIRAPGLDAAVGGAVAVHGASVWWSGTGGGVVWRVDAKSGRIVSTIRIMPSIRSTVEPAPVGLAATGDAVWVTVTPPP